MKQDLNVVWLKRDLRTQDHASLYVAEQLAVPYIILYCFEPSLIAHPDTSDRHLKFIYNSILDINKHLSKYNRSVTITYAEALEAFTFLDEKYEIHHVFSYQESGVMVTWQRDKSLKKFFNQKNIVWQQFQKDNVIRGIKNRKGWDQQWHQAMSKQVVANSYSISKFETIAHPFALPTAFDKLVSHQHPTHQPAGETMAGKYLRSFIKDRGFNYQKYISKPRESRLSCARISPYLAWGNISIKQAYHEVRFDDNFSLAKRAFTAFLTRLKWHCHFIQKFEVENTYETDCINAGYELLERPYNETVVRAWREGKTGYPLVDACMRCVNETGWINFRMRAMVVSFLCHHLDQDWRAGVYHLAQQFLDYEPGIHYPQFQMQAGTTGVNTVRIYNPIKQSQDHDPEGIFIKKWVPELAVVPTRFIHEPWKMTHMDQIFIQIELEKIYPLPIVDLVKSGQIARDKIWNHRKQEVVKEEKKRILAIHIRPNNK